MKSFFLVLFLGVSAYAETNSYDFEALSVTSSTAVGFTASKTTPTNGPRAKSVFITVEDNDIRFRIDGTAPTTTEGHKLTTSTTGLTITGEESIRKFRAIGISGTGDVKVTYER